MAQEIDYLDVFVSSTSKDLIPYRNAVRDAIMKIEGLHPIMMEDFNATDRNAMQKCYDEVARSEIFIGIYAYRYGFAPDDKTIYFREDDTEAHGDGETSITKWEFTWAKEMNLPMCCFVVDPTYDWTGLRDDNPKDVEQLEKFKQEIMQFVVGFFTDPKDLVVKVLPALVEIQKNYDRRKIRHVKRGRPFTAPSLSERFINRPDIFDPLVEQLINGNATALSTALAGGGGFGKTTLAIAACHDVRVRQQFTDGILWLQFRQDMTDNDVRALIEEQFKHITTETRTFKDLEGAKSALKDELAKRHILFVLDDVWQPDYAKIFVFTDPEARANTLITTRLKEVVVVNANLQQNMLNVQELKDSEGADLLALELSPAPSISEMALLTDLAKTLGNWAQMIELVAAELRMLVGVDGYTIPDAVEDIGYRLVEEGFISFSHDDEANRTKNLRASLELSLKRLKELRPRFEELAIFREDNDIPATSIALLWRGTANMKDYQIHRALNEMNRLSLFTRQHVGGNDLSAKWIRLHDVIRALMRHTLADETALHRTWTTTCDPYHLPDDYAWRNIGYHLDEADDLPTLRRLLLDYAWLEAKLTATDPNALIADCDLLPDDETIRLLADGITLSSHIITDDKPDFPRQLTGRLWVHRDKNGINNVWKQATHAKAPFMWGENLPNPPLEQAGGALKRILQHPSAVLCVAYSPDGVYLATGSKDNTARIWDATTGAMVTELRGHSDYIRSVSWDRDGKRIATGSDDGTARIWDATTGAMVTELRGHTYWVNSVSWDRDGKRIATGSSDNTARIWDATTGAMVRELRGHTGGVNSVSWDSAGKRLATGSSDNTARIWDATTGAMVTELRGHSGRVTSVSWDRDGKRIATGSDDKRARIWDATTGAMVTELRGHSSAVRSVSWDSSGKRIATGSDDTTARIWDVGAVGTAYMPSDRADIHFANPPVQVLAGHSGTVWSVSWDRDGKRIATGSSDNTARIWDVGDVGTAYMPSDRADIRFANPPVQVLAGHSGTVWSVSWDSAGKRIATGSSDNTARIWDATTGDMMRELRGHTNLVNSVSWDRDGKRIATGSDDTTARIWDATTGAMVTELRGHRDTVYSVSWDRDGKRIATGSDDKTARIWDIGAVGTAYMPSDRADIRFANPPVQVLAGHSGTVNSVSWDSAGKRLATGSSDKTARIWDATTGAMVTELRGHSRSVNSVSWDSAGKRIATGSSDNTARIWDVGAVGTAYMPSDRADIRFANPPVQVLEGHSDTVWSVSWDRDGKRIATGSSDTTARIWDAQTGQCLAVLVMDAPVLCVDWSPDGDWLALGDSVGRVVWVRVRV